MPDVPQAWVGCLGCYNSGRLVGRWVDATDAESVPVDSTGMTLPRSHVVEGHEEWWVMDHENFPAEFLSGECSPAEAGRIARLMAAIEADGVAVAAVAAWMADSGIAVDEWDEPTRSAFQDAYAGVWPSFRAYVEQLVEDCGWAGVQPIPDELRAYLNFELIERELALETITVDDGDGGVHVIRQT